MIKQNTDQRDYELIYDYYFKGISLRDISRQTNTPISTLSCRHKRILRHLRQLMETET